MTSTATIRETTTLTDQEWAEYNEEGYIRLGVVYPEEEIDRLCERIDDIMLGKIRYEGMMMQKCPSAEEEADETLDYRKVQDLEQDPIFRAYIQHPLFRYITRELIGEEISVFRSMFFNKPANGGVPLVWHQDGRSWNVDPYPVMTIYTALDAATKANGCIQIIPRSDDCPIHTVAEEEDIAKFAPLEKRVFLELEKGEVVMFKTRILHSSLVNTTDRPRRAFSIGYVDAATYHLETGKTYPRVFPV